MNLIGSKTIETKRLILRSSSIEEQKRLWEILMDPEVNKFYLTSAKNKANDKEYWTWQVQEKFYKSKVNKANNQDTFVWSIFLKPEYTVSGKEEVIGQVSTQENGNDIKVRDVGWFIDKNYQGNGYAKEAATAMIDYMFKEVEIDKISSGAVRDNIPSCKIFERLGFTKIGEVEEDSPYTFYDGRLIFSKYELTREMYLSQVQIIEYQDQYLDDVRDLLVELEEYILSIDEDNLDQLHPEYREKMALLDLEEVNNNNGKCYLAIHNNKVVGLVMGFVRTYDEYDYLDYKCPKSGEVSELIISKDARGAKIGKNLMNRIEDHFISIGCDYVFVDCFAYNKNAFEFYKKQGYHPRMYNNVKKLKKD